MQGTVCLGPRLLKVASYVPDQAKLGDIGTDHAYLPIYLWEEKRIRQAIAVDVHEGPYQSALAAIHNRGLAESIKVRFGDGLKPVHPGEVDTLTLAGMGGNTMLEIFEESPAVLKQVTDLILQPQGAEGKVRKTLLSSGWLLRDEQLVSEEGRVYGVMAYSRLKGKSLEELHVLENQWARRLGLTEMEIKVQAYDETYEILSKLFWELGPLILEQPVFELECLFREQIEPRQRAIKEMRKSQKEEVQEKIRQHEIAVSILEAMQKCRFPLA